MKTSEQINELASALASFQADLKPLTLDREVKVRTKTGGEYSFKYATFANCKETAQPLLNKHGLAVCQTVGEGGSVTTILMHKSGQYLSDTFVLEPMEKTPQGWGSAISYNKRYQFNSMLGLVADDDDDANIAEGNKFEAATRTHPAIKQTDPVLNEKDWMSPKDRGILLDRIARGEYAGKTGEQVLTIALKSFKIRREWQDEIRAAMNTPEAQTVPPNAESIDMVNRSIETIKKQKVS